MSYSDDPNFNRRERITGAERSSTGMWIAGAVAVCLVIGLVAFATTRSTNDTAMIPAPTTTTGSGAVTSGTDRPAQPAKPMPNEKAPAAPKQ